MKGCIFFNGIWSECNKKCFYICSLKSKFSWVFTTPELKAQVSFLITYCLSSICLSVNFSYFHFTLQNHLAKFNRTWHKASLGEGNSSLFNWRCNYPFQEKIIAKLQKYKEVMRIFPSSTYQIWHKALIRCFIICKITPLSKGDNNNF